jgi:hypothetical protein
MTQRLFRDQFVEFGVVEQNPALRRTAGEKRSTRVGKISSEKSVPDWKTFRTPS